MISPGGSKIATVLNAVATLIMMSWVVVVFPLYLIDLVEHHKINDEEFKALLEYMGGSGIVSFLLHGVAMWLNTPDTLPMMDQVLQKAEDSFPSSAPFPKEGEE